MVYVFVVILCNSHLDTDQFILPEIVGVANKCPASTDVVDFADDTADNDMSNEDFSGDSYEDSELMSGKFE